MKINNRLDSIEEYHFKTIETMKQKLINEGKEIFDFGIGEPDIKTNEEIVKEIVRGFKNQGFNRYPPYEGIEELKKSVIEYYKKTYNISLEKDEVLILIGSKEGISNSFPAFCDVGDISIVPALGYPVYTIASKLWGVKTYKMPLQKEKEYLPQYDLIPEAIVQKAKYMILNYPNNPTGAIATPEFYKETIEFSKKNNIVVCNDNAYNEIVNRPEYNISLLMYGKENVIEFGSFSKTFSMTGFRLAYVVGDRDAIKRILKIKSNVDSGQFIPIQLSGIKALSVLDEVKKSLITYKERRESLENIMLAKKIEFFKGKGSFYMWCKVPENYSTDEFCKELLYKSGIVVTPGYVFGYQGYGYFRVALTKEKDVIEKAFLRI